MTKTGTTQRFLKNGQLVLPDEVITSSILIDSGRIVSVGHEVNSGASETIDAAGLTIYPGFIDVHIHGGNGVDTMAANGEDLVRASVWLASQGATGWMPTLVPGPVEEYQRAVSAIEQAHDSGKGARILGVHYEGPFVNSAQCGALRTKFFRTYSNAKDLDDLPTVRSFRGNHLMTVAPEVDGGIELINELVRRGWIVSIGHTKADFDVLDQALIAGAKHMTHFMNAMAPLHHRSPGPVGWGLQHDDVTCDVIADGVHLDSQTLKLLMKVKGPDRLVLISDAIAAAGLGDGVYEIWQESITVKDRRTSNQRGSIAGSVISMLDAVSLMHSLGVPEGQLARISATNPARLLGIDNECGSIEVGKRADLVALDEAGKVRFTMVGGEVGYS
ncbi:MAG TPA: N-acetylglucosamine-6-phosphate deacetylase [Pyrinomonadaceae bacterium]